MDFVSSPHVLSLMLSFFYSFQVQPTLVCAGIVRAKYDSKVYFRTTEYEYVIVECHAHTCSLQKGKKGKIERKAVISVDILSAYALDVYMARPALKSDDCIAIACDAIGIESSADQTIGYSMTIFVNDYTIVKRTI